MPLRTLLRKYVDFRRRPIIPVLEGSWGMIGVSPTYLSKVERDEFSPPGEDKVKAIAKIINCDADELLARPGRVSSDLSDIIKRRPIELAALLRMTRGLTAEEMTKLARQVQKAKDK